VIEFHDWAAAEARDAQAYYAARSRRAAEGFRDQLTIAVGRIIATPLQFAYLDKPYRSARVLGFPYIVVFRLRDDETAFVVAVAHTSRRPRYWKDRE
jgi:hypothetical protein